MSDPPSELTQWAHKAVLRDLAGEPDARKLESALRLLAKWRAQVISNTLRRRSGLAVLSGPFKGMIYAAGATEGAFPARLIGCYEASLAPIIEEIIAKGYALVVDIGCAEGYYAVGLARRMPGARVLARDQDSHAQDSCRTMAEANGVAGRVEVGGLFTHADFDRCRGAKSVVICDIEGAEATLLDPNLAPGLAEADILVETHARKGQPIVDLLRQRFDATHDIQVIGRRLETSALPDWMEELGDLDRLLALWEWRTTPTPWIWMVRR